MHSRAQHTLAVLQEFLSTPLEKRLDRHRQSDAAAHALSLFQATVEEVPAYREFLQARGIDPGTVSDYADFQRLPLMTKKDYILAYPLSARCIDGRLEHCDTVAVSSGSTGKPVLWPRSLAHELDIAYRFEQVFRDGFHAERRRSLAVVCFALGTWVGGMFTAACCRYLALKGYPLTTVTPGNNKKEIFRVVEELGPHYDQVVLLGYPPFVKDVIDSGRARGIDWARYGVKLVFAGEVFSEEWRDLVCARIGANDPCHATASLYGTADGGVLGNETPLSITLRRFFAARPELARAVFGESRLPTLVQYDPHSRFFELHEGTLVVTGDNGVPLVRYHIADKGGIIPYARMQEIVQQAGGAPLEAQANRGVHPLPFVFVFGRADFTVSYFGANVYPENISVGLEQSPVCEWCSGKFVLQVVDTADRNKTLSIVVELLPGIEGDEAKQTAVADAILRQLLRLNSEFAHYVPREYQRPQVILKPAGDPEWFPPGVKHRYTKKS